jgi:hypothetical protein
LHIRSKRQLARTKERNFLPNGKEEEEEEEELFFGSGE